MSEKRLDLILYGATGFTGRQMAVWLARHAPPELRWAIAGRRKPALTAVAAGLGRPVEVLVADSGDEAAIDALVRQCRVVASTAGPYAIHGRALVASAARHGVHYADITGETQHVRRVIDLHHATARQTGAKIVPFCGFDSVPADLGALLMVGALRALGQGTRRITAGVVARGGFNGGTLASMLNLAAEDMAALGDPVLLNPEEARTDALRMANPDLTGPLWSDRLNTWLAPFFMAPVNTRVVRRSAALAAAAGTPYGQEFQYQEGLETGGPTPRLAAWGIARGMGLFETLVGVGWCRDLIARLGPKPGDGPSEEAMDRGFMRYRYAAEGEGGAGLLGELRFAGDPGNRATVAMLGSSALALALDGPALPAGGGVLTPASGIGPALKDRMLSAGFEWKVEAG